ncbi:hypothetical protein KY335_01670, partial [Candidatus Woesearchaeota archaeon]|nr:hypothetical protein [Candidatus Woesearchaeota archaeon]
MKLGSIVKGMWNTGRYLFGGAALASALLAPTADVLAQENSPEAEQERIIKKPDDYKPKITLEGPLEKDASVESG